MFIARAWSALLLLGLVPLYIKFLGVEAYGVVGAFVTLQSFISLLDLGLGPTLTRELARMSDKRENVRDMRNLLRTLEAIYFGCAVLIVLIVWMLAPLIADHWLRLGRLSSGQVQNGLIIAGIALASQWPRNLYGAGLEGLQRQMSLAWITAASATLRAALTLAALKFIAPTLVMFFLAQAIANAVQTAILASAVWAGMPDAVQKAIFSREQLRRVTRFASGMTGISITAVALTQLDKTVLSRTLPLKAFGYYVIAGTLAGGLYVAVGPIFAVVFPRLSALVSEDRRGVTSEFYHLSSQLMSVVLMPLTAVVALYSEDILHLWTGSQEVASNAHVLVTLLIVGNAMNGLMYVPYALQLANGWTSLAFVSNIVAIVICLPLTYYLSVRFGAEGGALVWAALTLGYMVTSLPLMHRKLLPDGLASWYLVDVGYPAVAAFMVVGLGRLLLPPTTSVIASILLLIGLGSGSCLGAAMAAPDIRRALITRVYAARAAG